ncbi:MAG: vtpJ-therm [Proteobacteria bacterium]|nr:vtpJ-therm [Pseudomonadota bacterium]
MRLTPLLVLLTACGNPLGALDKTGAYDYLGAFEPSSVDELGDGVVQYGFDPEDGPQCLHGDPYQMATRAGSGGPLLIALQGGGACWDDFCQAFDVANPGVPQGGILNPDLDANPVKDWDAAFVPYCDGSLFAGNAERDDDGDGTPDRIHRGLMNTSAALDVIVDSYPEPERIVLAGVSGGAYGSIIVAPMLRELYPNVPIDVVQDAGLALALADDPSWIEERIDDWGIGHLLPDSCKDCTANGHLTSFVEWQLKRDKKLRYFPVTSRGDFIIGTMFLDQDFEDYEAAVLTETARLSEAFPDRYASFVYGGSKHTATAVDSSIEFSGAAAGLPLNVDAETLDNVLGSFDETEVEGVTVADWLADVLFAESIHSVLGE